MSNLVIKGMGGTSKTTMTEEERKAIQDQIDALENEIARLLAIASCKLTQTDANTIIANLTSAIDGLEIIADDTASRQSELVALINALENKVNGL
jgi:hypothetical protein